MAKLKDKEKPAIELPTPTVPAQPKQSFQPVARPTPTIPANATKITGADGSVKYQETIPGTNKIREYDNFGKITYFGGADAQSRMAVEQANKKLASQQQQIAQAEQTTQLQQGVGQINPETLNPTDPLTQDIIANIQGQSDFNKVLDYSGTPMENLQRNTLSLTSRLVNPAVKILNKVSFGAGLGTAIVDELAKDKEVKRVISGFDTAQNVADIKDNLKRAESLKEYALNQAKTDPITAKQNYEEYLSIKRKSLAQMKALSRDPKQFVELRGEIALLNDYFDESKGIKFLDDEAMRMALQME